MESKLFGQSFWPRLTTIRYDDKPWAASKHPKLKWERGIFYGSVGIGVAIGAIICYMAYASVTNHSYCMILDDSFQSIDKGVWDFEIQRGGFGSGTFEWTTDDPKNAYTDAEGLHIVPTLTTDTTPITKDQIYDNYVLNLTTDGTCTTQGVDNCSIRSNKTAGTIINPVRSARLTTKGRKSITYGKIEVIAKMPKGNWLWPAIWMMPEKDTYGKWPAVCGLCPVRRLADMASRAVKLTSPKAEAIGVTTTQVEAETPLLALCTGARFPRLMPFGKLRDRIRFGERTIRSLFIPLALR
jgi:hypothetical protein